MKKLVFSCISWVPFILIHVCLETRFASSECLDNQRSFLLQLNSSLVFNLSSSSKLVTWDQTLDCCQWSGVQCNGSTGHVIGLDLSDELITGGVDNSSSLFELKYLKRLNLANNSFGSAEVPSGFGKLSGLTYLNLSNAGFSGQVPVDISQLEKLEVLDLSSLSYLGFPPLTMENKSFSMIIRNLTNLRELYLDGVVISANGSEWCKVLSSSVPHLQVLSLSNCNLSGEIDQSIENLQLLSVIRLDQNNLTTSVPGFIAKYRNLTLLKLSNCHLKGTFPPRILNVATLRTLDLSYNELLQGSLPEFQANNSLQTLILTVTKFSGPLPDSIGKLKWLRRIDMGNCSFSGQIPPLKSLDQLEYLDLSYNSFSGPIPAFSSAKNLMQLDLHHNALSGTLTSTDWPILSKLANLDMSYNSLNGTIPGSLLNLPSLLKLQLAQNKLIGQLPEIHRSSLIQTLDLSNNRLEGSIPESLFGLRGLRVLKLSSNRFNGSLDLNMIQQLKNLSTLALSFNRLSVSAGSTSADLSTFPQLGSLDLSSCNLHEIPPFLKNQTRILSLDLSDNQIHGRIPSWIWTIGGGSLASLNLSCNYFIELEAHFSDTPSLIVLDLHSNKIQGVIPKLPPSASYLDFSNNSFTSVLPSNVGDFLNSIVLFSISRNQISGSIPTSFCTSIYLQVLDLSYNQLNGTIPDCLIIMTSSLGVLNLRGNNLRGTVPDKFPRNCILRTLDVNGNDLVGSIPRLLANCKRLEVLDLGKNQFTDTFPQWLRSLPQLRVLVLRSNNFSGCVPCPFGDSMWPVLQIVDLASNNFDGELQGECFMDWKAMVVEGNQTSLVPKVLQYQFLEDLYYDVVSVTFKGSEYEVEKILTIFTSIDFSNNSFHGKIPEAIGNLNALKVLNLSHNGFSGAIPSSLGNLTMLESLDLSINNLSGSIPEELRNLNFLGYLNLSCNNLVGLIPVSTQLQSFDSSSYTDNKGLCGQPLSKNCPSNSTPAIVPPTRESKSSHNAEFDWQFILIGTGFGIGAGLVTAPVMFWKKGRKWHDEQVNRFVSTILLAFGISYFSFDEGRHGPEEGIGHQLFDISSYYKDEDEDEMEDEDYYGQFCVFCSKLDFQMRKVIHNPHCTCHGQSSIPSSG